ncbi:F0F1 ATP synthase subunit alpha, partial [Candidatus Roizmanbacteria bacterium]|nr:F0F1 ATP synthase subunit alpha [Candidatus Roizmanbacteria bacterium]
MKIFDEYLKDIERELRSTKTEIKAQDVGSVTQVMDGVISLKGLDNISYGEIIELNRATKALVVDLLPDSVGSIVLGDYLSIKDGDTAKATGVTLSLTVDTSLLGRVVNPLGQPLDGGAKIRAKKNYPIEKIAPGVVRRKPVNVPVQTGIKAIDALVPIGRGQRELIIGDRGTGKTTIAVDTILNQKKENLICIYCAIGQKRSKIASTVELLRKQNALDYSVVVAASASDSTSLQYLAPYAACAIGEYFMDQGKDALVIYDDLTKHAWAY